MINCRGKTRNVDVSVWICDYLMENECQSSYPGHLVSLLYSIRIDETESIFNHVIDIQHLYTIHRNVIISMIISQ